MRDVITGNDTRKLKLRGRLDAYQAVVTEELARTGRFLDPRKFIQELRTGNALRSLGYKPR